METTIKNPADFSNRLLAAIFDLLIIGMPLYFIVQASNSEAVGRVMDLIAMMYWLLVPIYWSGYTVGKRIVGIRIVKTDGSKLGFGAMLLRNWLTSLIYVFTFGVAFIVSIGMVIFRKDRRALHDLIAKTYVTTDRPDNV